MGKRGATQIDWAISLALFVLFVTWFFIFIKPIAEAKAAGHTQVYSLEKAFEDEASWTVQRVPLFLRAENQGSYKPVHVNYTLGWPCINTDYDYVISDKRLFILANISSDASIIWLTNQSNCTHAARTWGLSATELWATTSGNMSAYFDESLPVKAYYKGELRINSTAYAINTIRYNVTNHSFNESGFLAQYVASSEAINFSTYVYARNPIIHTILTLNHEDSYIISLAYELYNYSNYFSSNIRYGTLRYTEDPKNISYIYDYVTFYNSNDSLSMFFDRNVTIHMTYYNDALYVNITLPIDETAEYRMVLHDGDYRKAVRQDYQSAFGVIEERKGLSLDKLRRFNYTDSRQRWNYPKDFQILVFNATRSMIETEKPMYRYGIISGDFTDVYSERINYFIMDEEGRLHPATINIRTW